MRVASVDDDIPLFNEWQKGVDEVIHRLAGHDEQHDAARLLELGNEFLHGMGANHILVACAEILAPRPTTVGDHVAGTAYLWPRFP